MLLKLGFETGHVYSQIMVGGQAIYDLDRNSIGGVQAERVLGGNHVGTGGAGLAEGILQETHSVFQVPQEAFLFLTNHGLDPWHAIGQVGVAPLHGLCDGWHQMEQERISLTHLVGIEYRTPEQAADHIALLLWPGPKHGHGR